MDPSRSAILAIDVGGTTIGSAVIDTGLNLMGAVVVTESSNNKPRAEVIADFKRLISTLQKQARVHDLSVKTCSIAMPNPFDYDNGVSYMKHKFVDLHGVNLKTTLSADYPFPIMFLNDADAFGYGASRKLYSVVPTRLVSITLGTGIGSSFFNNGRLADVEIWETPYKDGILEDYISTRALGRHYTERTGDHRAVKEMADLANAGDSIAMASFKHFGDELGEGLAVAVGALEPDTIVFGGAISKASSLFRAEAEITYQRATGTKTTFNFTSEEHFAVYGAAAFAIEQLALRTSK
jgi:glucokinase